jgi:hypothetical protein
MEPLKYTEYTRVASDTAGETHFGAVPVALRLTNFAPPARPCAVGEFMPASQFAFCAPATGWYGDWHPTPQRQLFLILAGVWQVTVSDGEARRFSPDSAVLLEDVIGKGHLTEIVGEADGLAGIVQLPA